MAPGLRAEAATPDGTIETVSVTSAKAFVLGVRWHPEYQVMDNPDSVKTIEAFGNTVRAYPHGRAGVRSDLVQAGSA